MHILNFPSAIKKITIYELKDFLFEIYYGRIAFSKENRYYLMKYQGKKSKIVCN